MQTFLPSDDFALCAMSLDRQRLGKQRVETLQIMQTLAGLSRGKGWINHPATKMWKGHEDYLMLYQIAICEEWISRGYKDTCMWKTFDALGQIEYPSTYPEWMGDNSIHSSHRSNLLRKDPDFYSQFGWQESDDLDYVWPVQ